MSQLQSETISVECLHNLDSNNKDSSILSLVGITRVLVADMVAAEEEVVEDHMEDMADMDEV
jgi:hypothetical protein